MWKPRCHPVALTLIGLCLATAILLCSCDDAERHRMLTFFFDGVPPLPGQGGEAGSPDANAPNVTANASAAGWHVHKPLSNCTDCHGSGQRQGFSRQVRLVASVPQLCYKCHEGYAHLEGWVHGPVAVGECLLCHEPHKSRNEFLLVKRAPELCYGCHQVQTIRQIEGHAQESYAHCNDCHEGHAGATKNLLKPALLGALIGRTPPPEVRPESEVSPREAPAAPAAAPQAPAAAPQAPAGGSEQRPMTPADRYDSSVQAYHAGRFAEAREGFLEVLKNRAAPPSMKEMARDYLEKIEWLQQQRQLPGWRPDK